jgi:hypothetical protein
MKFDWDDGNRAKCSERVPIAEIEAVPSDKAKRGFARQVGTAKAAACLSRSRLIDGEIHLRPISARYIHRGKS